MAIKSNRFSNASNGGNDAHNKKGNKPRCDHCKKPGHTHETYWKLHENPPHLKNEQFDQVTGRALQTILDESTLESSLVSLNKEQLESLMKFLN